MTAPDPTPTLVLQKKLGRRIRVVRKERRLSQRILASLCGLHVSHLSKIERGAANATIGSLAAIAGALKVDLIELLRDPSPTTEPILANHG